MTLLLRPEEPRHKAQRGFALFALGFRPFYLLASVYAALSIALWAVQFVGWTKHAYLAGPAWHAHEMLWGFVLAVIVGFLFTAVRNWTGRPTPTGAALAALAALWLAGRVLVLTPHAIAAAVINVAFPLAAAAALARPLVGAQNRRNYFFVALLLLLALLAALFHAEQLGAHAWPAGWALRIALDVVLFILSVMAGRVISMFTNNAVPQADAQRRPGVERAALGLVLALLAADALGLAGTPLALLAGAACAAQAARWALWHPWRTLRVPLVWVLHAAYLWIPLHLALRAAAAVDYAAPSIATHALTAGAMGGLIIAMMTRTARGHTGRELRADRYDVASYALVLLAAVTRVGLPLIAPQWLLQAVIASAALWSAGFGLYALRYAPSLLRPRADGRAG